MPMSQSSRPNFFDKKISTAPTLMT